MGLFAVLSVDPGPTFAIEQCHINLWRIPGLGRHIYLWDVGLELNVEKGDLSSVRLALPFDTNLSQTYDLTSAIRNQEAASLIFGESKICDQEIQTRIRTKARTGWWPFGAPQKTEPHKFQLQTTNAGATAVSVGYASDQVTVCDVPLNQPIHAGEVRYLRIRFTIRNPRRVWTWRGNPTARKGALVDIRVNDVRETVSAGLQQLMGGHVLPIPSLYVFVIAPWDLRQVLEHPTFRYVRILEGRAWERYLRWSTGIIRPAKLVIYSWGRDDVTTATPFVGFLRFTADRPGPSWASYVALLVAVFGIAYFADVWAPHWPGLPALPSTIWSAIGFPKTFTLLGALGALVLFLELRRNVRLRAIWEFVTAPYFGLETWIFGRNRDL